MPLPPAADIARVTMTFNDTTGNEMVNVQHFKRDGGIASSSHLAALLGVIEDWLSSDWDSISSNQVTCTRLEALDLSAANSFYVDNNISVPGTGTANAMPMDDTLAISLRTGLAGRSFRGRLFHVGLREDMQDGGFIDSTIKATIIAAYEALRADILTAGWYWGVLSYYADKALRATPLFTEYTSVVITDDIVDSMKTRKNKT